MVSYLTKFQFQKLKTKIKNEEDIKKVTFELNLLYNVIKSSNLNQKNISQLADTLKKVNLQLWDIEDKIRNKERNNSFDDKFIELARSVYKTNDTRSKIKNKINASLNSKVFEVKSYEKYQHSFFVTLT